MKAWPIITLVGLIWGSFYADGMNTGRESNPHPRHRVGEFDPGDALIDMPHRVATIGYMAFFNRLLQQGTEWTDDPKAETRAIAEADGDLVDSDPAKKLFWHTVFGPNDPNPFPGWNDPNPNPNPNYPAYNPSQFNSVGAQIDGVARLTDDEDAASALSTHIQGVGEGVFGGALKALNNLSVGAGGSITLMPCETILVNGVCLAPCKKDDPLCKDDDGVPIALKPPNPILGGDPVGPVGGGGGGPVGGSGGGVNPVVGGAAPEPSTWLMLAIGFLLMSWFGYRKRLY